METPPKVPDLTWKKDDGSVGMGKGELTLVITDGTLASGVIAGEANGPLGQQRLVGIFDDTTLRFDLVPTDPTSSSAMTGSGVGEIKEGEFSGSLRVSGPKGVEVREVTFTLKPTS